VNISSTIDTSENFHGFMSSSSADFQRISCSCVMSSSLSDSTQICKFFDRGKCKFGKRCKFLHIHNSVENQSQSCSTKQEKELSVCSEVGVEIESTAENQASWSSKKSGEDTIVGIGLTAEVKPTNHDGSAKRSNHCRYFYKYGKCNFGENCRFQHIACSPISIYSVLILLVLVLLSQNYAATGGVKFLLEYRAY